MNLTELRKQLATFDQLPGDTPVVIANSAEGNGFSPLATIDDALYEAHNTFTGDWYATDQMRAQNPENGWDPAPYGTVPAVFLWPTS
ncbi:hypothetical protein [Streptomyces sp. NPDC101455]|uniref:hypothetical protein n=1 Tax=Streptomyces sp. NPDC101455 TaxID=3366142 RepID=UPI0037F79100